MSMITTGEFVNLIWDEYSNEKMTDILQYGRSRGWLTEQDALWYNHEIDRRSAAVIIHEFLRIECGAEDVRDWTRAKKLKDLYDCRVCAKHVAWVYEKGIMPALGEDRFMLLHKVGYDEAKKIVEKMSPFMR